MEISQKILNYMDSRGVSAYKLHKAIGISESTFSKWKSKPTSKIDASILSDIADYFEITIDELLGNEQKNKPTDTVDELDELDIKIVKLFSQLTPQNKQLALAQIGAILNAQDNQLV